MIKKTIHTALFLFFCLLLTKASSNLHAEDEVFAGYTKSDWNSGTLKVHTQDDGKHLQIYIAPISSEKIKVDVRNVYENIYCRSKKKLATHALEVETSKQTSGTTWIETVLIPLIPENVRTLPSYEGTCVVQTGRVTVIQANALPFPSKPYYSNDFAINSDTAITPGETRKNCTIEKSNLLLSLHTEDDGSQLQLYIPALSTSKTKAKVENVYKALFCKGPMQDVAEITLTQKKGSSEYKTEFLMPFVALPVNKLSSYKGKKVANTDQVRIVQGK